MLDGKSWFGPVLNQFWLAAILQQLHVKALFRPGYSVRMKQRITYLPSGGIERDAVQVGDYGINVTTADPPAIEKRITTGLSELPAEVGNAHPYSRQCR
jgi:hypothetical protein